MTKTWSTYQQAIFTFAQNEKGNAVIEAVAGSGKSTTLEELCKRLKGNGILLAFNKAIAEELKARGINARTFHSLCFSPVMKARGVNQPELDKLHKLCKEKMKSHEFTLYAAFAKKMVGLARQVGIGCLVPDTEMAWIDICDHHDIELENDGGNLADGINFARALLDWSNASNMVDFDDMLYFAVKDGITLPKFDYILIDEAQDTNAIQRAILRKLIKQGTRVFAVGDPAQAIYGFRGADSNSLNMIAEEFNCKRLPLSITYRCPQVVVRYAQQWVDHIQARDGAPEGELAHLGMDWSDATFQAGDLVVCRKTAPLIQFAFKMIRANKPVMVLGREIGQGLKALIKKMNARDIEHLEEKLEAYMVREIEKARAKGNESQMDAIADKVGCILFLVNNLKEDRRDIPSLEAGIDYLFANKDHAVICATIHKSKGLEADRVFWLDRDQCPAQWARKEWQQEQERNLCYVATTRAKKALYTFNIKEAE